MAEIFEVSQINEYLRQRFEADEFLGSLLIRGELSNYKIYPSGHHYFTLKDSQSAIRCVMFKGSAMRLRFRPETGMTVIAGGRIAVFPRKLQAEGLFARERKQALPRFPHRIAIITSSAGAALHDMLRILRKRYPLTEVKLLGVRVQGAEAPAEIAGAIRYANRWELADLIITGRGGGSMEDLWAFNDERVARAIADSHIPVISAVGHEPDVTISDFVADLRAATPSNAAELAVPDQTELRQHLAAQRAMLLMMTRRLKQERQRVAQLTGARALRDPKNYIDDRRMQLDYTQRRLIAALQRLVAQQRERFVRLTSKLDAMSPLKVLSRGYSMTFDAQGHVVRSVRTLSCGDRITVRLADGRASAEVREIQEDAT